MHLASTLEQTDEHLARAARAGSLECFEELVRRYQVPLLRFLQRRLPHRHDAEDIVQDAFLRAYQSIHRYREDQPFKPWLFTIAYRSSIDASRRRWPRQSADDDLVNCSEDGPMVQAAAKDAKHHLWQLVRTAFKDEPFTTVWLYYGESMSSDEIADVIGRSRAWVKTTLLRSRQKIKYTLQQSESAGQS
jgi:RNA polymerase sigma-70 factor (ECF subfamily)